MITHLFTISMETEMQDVLMVGFREQDVHLVFHPHKIYIASSILALI